MIGNHLVKSWSNTQSIVSLSSGEAEYYGIVKGSSMALGIKSMMADFGVTMGVRIKTDASAAKGIANRTGLGKIRHIHVNQLWVQDRVAMGDIVIDKICGMENCADALTKHVNTEDIRVHLHNTNQELQSGRHQLAPA